MRGALRAAGCAGRAVALALALAAGVAFAQAPAVKAPKRVQPPPVASVDDDASAANVTGGVTDSAAPGAVAPSLRGPLGGGASPPAPILRSAVRSRWSAPATIASQGGGACRAQCATTRVACLAATVEDDVQRCNTGWTRCLSTCDGLDYARAATPAP